MSQIQTNRAAISEAGINHAGDWKSELKQLKLAYIARTAPGFYVASGGASMKIKPYSDNSSNALCRAIIDFLTFSGWTATRINTTGMMRKVNGQMKWARSGTRRGTADIHAVIAGRAVSIEIKMPRDKQSEYQIREQERIERAGGIYIIARNFPDFLTWYKQTFHNDKE